MYFRFQISVLRKPQSLLTSKKGINMKQVEMNKNMKLSELNDLRLSPHFTLGELCKTNYKTADGNIPSRVVIENLRNLCENWLEDLR